MKLFIEEYGLSLLIAIVALLLIFVCTPVGSIVKEGLGIAVNELRTQGKTTYSVGFFAGENGYFDDETCGHDENVSMCSIEVEKNEKLGFLPSPKSKVPGYVFDGWFVENKAGHIASNEENGSSLKVDKTEKVSESKPIQGNVNFYARWRSDGTVNTDKSSGLYSGHLYIDGEDVGTLKVMSTFDWYGYNWTVLKISGNRAYIISTYALDTSFSIDAKLTEENGVSWEDRYVAWNRNSEIEYDHNGQTVTNMYFNTSLDRILDGGNLSGSFYNVVFGGNEEAIVDYVISSGTIDKDENLYSQTRVNTRHVFAPSYTEIREYLDSDSKRVAYNGSIAKSYWTRSGVETDKAVAVFHDGTFANYSVEDTSSIRPAMVVNLAKIRNISNIE